MYKDQPNWVGKIQAVPQDQLEAAAEPAAQPAVREDRASLLALQDWAAARGVPPAKSTQCLSDEKAVDQLVQMTSDATTQYPDFQGTPTFIINGKMVEHSGRPDPCGIS